MSAEATPAIDLRDRVAEALTDAVIPIVNDAIRTRLSKETTRADEAEHRLFQVSGAARRDHARADDAEATRDRWRERAEAAEELNLKLIAQAKEQAVTIERAVELRDKWLKWPKDDPHYGAGLMLARRLDLPMEASDG